MSKIKQILIKGVVSYSVRYGVDEEAKAHAWYQQQIEKPNFIPEEHTVQDVADPDYIAPEEVAENERLTVADIKFKKLTLAALKDINKAQPNLFSPETKQLFQELRALLR